MVASARMAVHWEPYIPMDLNMMNMGVSSTLTGSIWVTRKPRITPFFPRKR